MTRVKDLKVVMLQGEKGETGYPSDEELKTSINNFIAENPSVIDSEIVANTTSEYLKTNPTLSTELNQKIDDDFAIYDAKVDAKLLEHEANLNIFDASISQKISDHTELMENYSETFAQYDESFKSDYLTKDAYNEDIANYLLKDTYDAEKDNYKKRWITQTQTFEDGKVSGWFSMFQNEPDVSNAFTGFGQMIVAFPIPDEIINIQGSTSKITLVSVSRAVVSSKNNDDSVFLYPYSWGWDSSAKVFNVRFLTIHFNVGGSATDKFSCFSDTLSGSANFLYNLQNL